MPCYGNTGKCCTWNVWWGTCVGNGDGLLATPGFKSLMTSSWWWTFFICVFKCDFCLNSFKQIEHLNTLDSSFLWTPIMCRSKLPLRLNSLKQMLQLEGKSNFSTKNTVIKSWLPISDPVVFCMNMHIASTRGSEIFATPFARKGFGLGMDGFNVSLDVGWSWKGFAAQVASMFCVLMIGFVMKC